MAAWPYQLFPHHLASRCIGALANCRWGWLKNGLIRGAIKAFNIDLSQATTQDIQAYPCFNAFFTRTLTPEARPIVQGKHNIACPIDGVISEMGTIHNNQLYQAKGIHYDLEALIGGNASYAKRFYNGEFMTFYLSPRDYHRIHMPCEGQLTEMIYIPGQLFPVKPSCVRSVPHLFSRNERVVCLFDTPQGPMSVILIGALFVGSITTAWAGTVTPPHQGQVATHNYVTTGPTLQRGEYLGQFNMGSSVIILFGPELNITWRTRLAANQHVLMGQGIGRIA